MVWYDKPCRVILLVRIVDVFTLSTNDDHLSRRYPKRTKSSQPRETEGIETPGVTPAVPAALAIHTYPWGNPIPGIIAH